MKNSKFVIDKLSKIFEQGLIVFRMKLTSKDEFEILSKRVENLEKKINQIKKSKKRKN